jgi:hypothetical protein
MLQFWKSPQFWITAIVILWLLYLIDGNLEQPVELYIIPHFLHRTVRVASVMAGSAVIGSILTIVIQVAWRRRASKNASVSTAAAASSSKTVA